jgi:hypothetical protein
MPLWPDQRFRRHAADVDASAADRAVPDESNLRALFGGCDRGRESGRTVADNHEVVAAISFVLIRCAAVAHGFNSRAFWSVAQRSAALDEVERLRR